jgi:hypothetical protein
LRRSGLERGKEIHFGAGSEISEKRPAGGPGVRFIARALLKTTGQTRGHQAIAQALNRKFDI